MTTNIHYCELYEATRFKIRKNVRNALICDTHNTKALIHRIDADAFTQVSHDVYWCVSLHIADKMENIMEKSGNVLMAQYHSEHDHDR